MINFDCKPEEYGSFSHSNSGSDGYQNVGSNGYGSSGYDSSNGYGGSGSVPQYKCKKTPETKCYTTPRTVSTEYCQDSEEEVCEKLTERVPVPRPKQVKKYVYTKQCRPVPKTVCDNADQMSLVPSCVPASRKECSYHPEERCENVLF